jgi:homoserine O-acetyltransferase
MSNLTRGARRSHTLQRAFAMRRGGVLPSVTIALESWGELDAARDNVVLLFTGLSPSAHAASSTADPTPGWWEEMVGPGRALDTDLHHVVCVNSLGSCFGSTGPASVDPVSSERWGPRFPILSVEDIAAAAHAMLAEQGIARVRAVVGNSLGGMSALAYALLFPQATRAAVLSSSAAHSLPFAIAIRSLQREHIRRDPAFREGWYSPDAEPVEGMRMARKLGMMSYRSTFEWDQRFGRQRVAQPEDAGQGGYGPQFEIEAYLQAHAERFVGGFDANCYLQISRAMDLFDAAEHGADGTLAAAFARLQLEAALVVGVETDILFPVHQQAELARLLAHPDRRVGFARLDCIQGHDSFLIEHDRFTAAIKPFLDSLA